MLTTSLSKCLFSKGFVTKIVDLSIYLKHFDIACLNNYFLPSHLLMNNLWILPFIVARHFTKGIKKRMFKSFKLKSCPNMKAWQKSVVNMVWYSISTSIGEFIFCTGCLKKC